MQILANTPTEALETSAILQHRQEQQPKAETSLYEQLKITELSHLALRRSSKQEPKLKTEQTLTSPKTKLETIAQELKLRLECRVQEINASYCYRILLANRKFAVAVAPSFDEAEEQAFQRALTRLTLELRS